MITARKSQPPSLLITGEEGVEVHFPTNAFYGDPKKYNFGDQQSNFEALVKILDRNNLHFTSVGAGTFNDERKFVAVVGSPEQPLLLWEHIMLDTDPRNVLHFDGHRLPVKALLRMTAREQDDALEPLRLRGWMDT